jgi:hypothetical protein
VIAQRCRDRLFKDLNIEEHERKRPDINSEDEDAMPPWISLPSGKGLLDFQQLEDQIADKLEEHRASREASTPRNTRKKGIFIHLS